MNLEIFSNIPVKIFYSTSPVHHPNHKKYIASTPTTTQPTHKISRAHASLKYHEIPQIHKNLSHLYTQPRALKQHPAPKTKNHPPGTQHDRRIPSPLNPLEQLTAVGCNVCAWVSGTHALQNLPPATRPKYITATTLVVQRGRDRRRNRVSTAVEIYANSRDFSRAYTFLVYRLEANSFRTSY